MLHSTATHTCVRGHRLDSNLGEQFETWIISSAQLKSTRNRKVTEMQWTDAKNVSSMGPHYHKHYLLRRRPLSKPAKGTEVQTLPHGHFKVHQQQLVETSSTRLRTVNAKTHGTKEVNLCDVHPQCWRTGPASKWCLCASLWASNHTLKPASHKHGCTKPHDKSYHSILRQQKKLQLGHILWKSQATSITGDTPRCTGAPLIHTLAPRNLPKHWCAHGRTRISTVLSKPDMYSIAAWKPWPLKNATEAPCPKSDLVQVQHIQLPTVGKVAH